MSELLTLPEVAARLRLSVRSVRRLTASGALPIIRVSPRRVSVPSAAVEQYMGLIYMTPYRSSDSSVIDAQGT
jgi:excisionase family DNA binding protein